MADKTHPQKAEMVNFLGGGQKAMRKRKPKLRSEYRAKGGKMIFSKKTKRTALKGVCLLGGLWFISATGFMVPTILTLLPIGAIIAAIWLALKIIKKGGKVAIFYICILAFFAYQLYQFSQGG